jgi:SET domain-containing protein
MSYVKNFNDFINEDDSIKSEEPKTVMVNQPFGLLRKKNRTHDSAKVSFGYTAEGGLSVFARKDIKDGEVIEVVPVLILNKRSMGVDTLNDYLFVYNKEEETYALPLCYGALYNHDEEPNADWSMDFDNQQMRFVAKRNILNGQEITISYGNDWNNDEEIKNNI